MFSKLIKRFGAWGAVITFVIACGGVVAAADALLGIMMESFQQTLRLEAEIQRMLSSGE